MGLLDAILKQTAARGGGQAAGLGAIADLVMKNPQILSAALSMLNPKDTSVGGGGGLARRHRRLQQGRPGGHHVVLGRGRPQQAGRPGGARERPRPRVLGQFAQKAGIGHEDASSVLASVLPELINHMTPQGQVPQGNALDGVLGSLLGQLGGR